MDNLFPIQVVNGLSLYLFAITESGEPRHISSVNFFTNPFSFFLCSFSGFTPAPVKPRPSPAPPDRTPRPLLRDYDATNSSPSPSAAASSSSSTCAAIQQSIQRQAREAETSRPWLQQLLPAIKPTAQICAAKTARLSKVKQSHQHRWWSSWDTEKQPPRHRWSLQAAASADLRAETV